MGLELCYFKVDMAPLWPPAKGQPIMLKFSTWKKSNGHIAHMAGFQAEWDASCWKQKGLIVMSAYPFAH